MITTLPAKIPTPALQILSLNPAAVYISLVRVALMKTYRADAPGNAPYSKSTCALFTTDPGGHSVLVGGKLVPLTSSMHVPSSLHISNATLQAYCHAVVTNNDLWLAAVGWGVGFFVVGIVFFWQAESKYGRG
jgi:hypothetical protein